MNPPCMFQKDHWECANAACGRPFVVDCEALVAPVTARDDWRAVLLTPSPVAPELAAELAAHWTHIGQLEHASVAAFARFVLQLLGVGAPPSLVLAAQQALADEVEHARFSRRWRMPSLQRSKPEGTGGSVKAWSAGVATVSQAGAPVSSPPVVPSLPVSGLAVVSSPVGSLSVAAVVGWVPALSVPALSVPGPAVVGLLVPGSVAVAAVVPALLVPLSSLAVVLSIGPQATRPRAASRV